MDSTIKVSLAAAAVIAVVVAGINFLPPNDAAVGGPSSPSTSASPLPSSSQQVDRMGLGGTDQHFSVDLPEGWENNEWVANNHPLGGDTTFFVGLRPTIRSPQRSPRSQRELVISPLEVGVTALRAVDSESDPKNTSKSEMSSCL